MTGIEAESPARSAFRRGLLASGIGVDGLVPSHNRQVAADMFRTVTQADPGVCDGWMGRVLAGEDSVEVLAGGWAAAETFGREIRRLGVLGADFRPLVFDGLFLQLPIGSADALRCAYATVLIREANYSQAHELLSSATKPTDPFDADMHTYACGLLHFRTQRWSDVLRLFPVDKRWYRPEYECAATAMASSILVAVAPGGCRMPRRSHSSDHSRRSSARSIAAAEVPSTSEGSMVPASLSGVCPPKDTSTPASVPFARSISMTSRTWSGVNGSMYSREEVS
jgi:hypothetical protein